MRADTGMDLCSLGAAQGAHLVRQGKLSPVEWTKACLQRIHRLDPSLHAWAHLDDAAALRQAQAVADRLSAGDDVGPLAGVPVGVKDIFNTIDMPTQMGSPLWKGFTPGNDARVVFALRQAGAIVAGKTVTAEFAVHAPGPTRNPHNPEHAPGTSSSGSAVAVATGMVPVALGTQTAGSILRPASYCGVYGYKPSFGLLPRTGMLKTTDSLDTVGFFSRTPQDLRLLLEVLRVRGPDYPLSNAAFSDAARQSKGSRPWRIAVAEHPKSGLQAPYATAALQSFIGAVGKAPGFTVESVTLPASVAEAHATHATIYDRTLAYYFQNEFKQHSLISPIMYEIIQRGNQLTLEDYRRALDDQHRIAKDIDHFMQSFDAFLTLSTAGQAPRGLTSPDVPDSCLIWTLAHTPSVNVPAFRGPDGLPFGAQLVSRRFNDGLLMSLVEDLAAAGLAPNPCPWPAAKVTS